MAFRARVWAGVIGGWALAAVAAGVVLLPLASTIFDSTRWGLLGTQALRAPFPLVAEHLSRWLLPNPWGIPGRDIGWSSIPWVSTAVFAGGSLFLLGAMGLGRLFTHRPMRAFVLSAGVLGLAAYHIPGPWHLLELLPLVGDAPQHRLLFLLDLAAALLLGAGLERFAAASRPRWRSLGVGLGATVAGLALLWWRFLQAWRDHDLVGYQAGWTAWVFGASILLILLSRCRTPMRRLILLAFPAVLAVELALAHHAVHPAMPLADLYPETPAVEFLRGANDGRAAGWGGALHPNGALVHGLYDIQGDESIKMARYERYYAAFSRPEPITAPLVTHWGHPRLDELGLRWVLTRPGRPSPQPDWSLAYDGPDAQVWKRPKALPLVRWAGGEGSDETVGVRIEGREPGRWHLRTTTGTARSLVIAECWDRGWRARIDGQSVPLEAHDDVFLSVRVPAGEHTIELVYRPHLLGVGLGASLLGISLLLTLGRRDHWSSDG